MQKFILGNCLEVLKTVEKHTVDAVYLDPPFNSGRIYTMSDENAVGFTDKWTDAEYDEFIRKVVDLCYECLKPTGTLFFHISADCMFIPEKVLRAKFLEVQPIFWKKCRSKNNVTSKLGATIDIIFKCVKSRKPKFNLVYQDKDAKYLKNSFKNSDERGNYSLGHVVTEPMKMGYLYEFEFAGVVHNPKTGWRIKKEELEALRDDNRLHAPKTKGAKLYKKIYLVENPGKPCTDLWDDIHSLAQGNEERKYPTAKPVGLLERIISISTDKGDLVLDPMCGSGTTGVACRNLERRCMLIDQNPDARDVVVLNIPDVVIATVTPDVVIATVTPDVVIATVTPDVAIATVTPDVAIATVTPEVSHVKKRIVKK
jgi:DNA modification methylase